MKDLPISVAAMLIAEACNIGLVPVTDPNNEALTKARLSHVDQNYVNAETHAAANTMLIAAQSQVPIAQLWGGGLLTSVDGLRFVVPVRSLNSGPSPKYFGYKRGLTWLNAVNDQACGIGAQVVAGTPRDSLHILDVLLNLDAGPKPDLIATAPTDHSRTAPLQRPATATSRKPPRAPTALQTATTASDTTPSTPAANCPCE